MQNCNWIIQLIFLKCQTTMIWIGVEKDVKVIALIDDIDVLGKLLQRSIFMLPTAKPINDL